MTSWYTNWFGLGTESDPQTQLQQKVQFLSSGFFQPTSGSTSNILTSATGVTLTVEQLILGQFLNREGAASGPINDTTPTASELITYLRKLVLPFPVSQGFAWNVAYYNQTGQTVTLLGGSGVAIGTAITLASGKISTLRFYVTDVTSGSENVYVSLLGN